jgi:outer membrane protein OmpA-like peptidoglycan-associated protein/tetratricopeptide (TPR) repeat protein
MKKFWYLVFLFFLSIEIQAQNKINAPEIFKEGYENLLSNDYSEALFSFNQLDESGNGNSNISYLKGICYLNIPGKEESAIKCFEEAVKNISESYAEGSFEEASAPLEAYYCLAQAYRITGAFQQAKQMFITLENLIDTVKSRRTFFLLQHELTYLNNAEVLMKLPINVEIKNVGNSINSANDEINPAISSDESSMYFVMKKKFYDAIYQDKKAEGEWTEKEEITNRLGSDGEYQVLSVSADGTKMLLYAYDMYSSGDIYESKFLANKWSKCKKLNKNINSSYSENFASYSPDGKTLYFTSNRPGGLGGYDIYKSETTPSGDWSEAVNLGPVINTEYDEATPMVSSNGEYLFFSSKGHLSMGGFDIFRSKITQDGYLYPRNVGYPLNSTRDNLNWVPVGDGMTGYMPAILPTGLGGYDIWKIHIHELPEIPRFVISGSVRSNDFNPGDSTKFTIILTNLATKMADGMKDSESGKAVFEFKRAAGHYSLDVSASGYTSISKDLLLNAEQTESEIHLDLKLEKIIKIQQKRTFKIEIIFFDFDSRSIHKKYYSFLDSISNLLKEYPDLQVEITGFTDGIGKVKYNNRLSVLRSEAVQQFFASRNIDKTRLHCIGKGSSNPIARERTKQGRDLAAGRIWNRRVEIIVSPSDKFIIQNIVPPVPAGLRIDK